MQSSAPRIQDGRLELTGIEQLAQSTLNIHVPLPGPVLLLVQRSEGSRLECGAAFLAGLLRGVSIPAPPPRGGGRSLIRDHSSSLINPRRALCSSPVQADGKSSRPKRFNASW